MSSAWSFRGSRASIGGWKTRSVFERYAIVSQSDIRDAMAKLESRPRRLIVTQLLYQPPCQLTRESLISPWLPPCTPVYPVVQGFRWYLIRVSLAVSLFGLDRGAGRGSLFSDGPVLPVLRRKRCLSITCLRANRPGKPPSDALFPIKTVGDGRAESHSSPALVDEHKANLLTCLYGRGTQTRAGQTSLAQ
jgi:hypothetical protein